MDPRVKPGADFFIYANGSWDANTEIPADRSGVGIWLTLTEEIEHRSLAILEEVSHASAPAGSSRQKLRDYYASFVDEEAIEQRGLAPLIQDIARVAAISDARSLAAYLGSELRADVDWLNSAQIHTDRLFGIYVDGDLNDPAKNAAYLMQGGLGMPEKSFYLDDSPTMAQHRDRYERYLASILKAAKVVDPADKARRAVTLERRIASVHISFAEAEDVAKANNPWPRSEFGKRAPGLDWETYFKAAGLDHMDTLIAWMPGAIEGEAALVTSVPLTDWKAYLTARVVDRHAAYLPKAFYDARFSFYETELHGVPTPPPRARRALEVMNALIPDELGREYAKRWFPPESKKAIGDMVATIVLAFRHRIDGLGWMAPETKAKAKAKLDTLRVGVGYPDQWADDSALAVARGDAYGNVDRAVKWVSDQRLGSVGKPTDRGKWEMPIQVVDAQNLPIRNALTFPAGILSPPFFNPASTAAANYGAIGAAIGHEISHSFDNIGASFDAQGRFVNWWTKDEFARFEAAGQALVAQYSAYKPFPDAAIDGKQCLAENIADLAGLTASYDAYRASLNGAPPPTQDGLTGDQQFFLAFAQAWRMKFREATVRTNLKTDSHAPPHYRVFTVRNNDAWYAAFGVGPNDPMFLPPDGRVRLW